MRLNGAISNAYSVIKRVLWRLSYQYSPRIKYDRLGRGFSNATFWSRLWRIDDNLIAANREIKPHQVSGQHEVVRRRAHKYFCDYGISRNRHQVVERNHTDV